MFTNNESFFFSHIFSLLRPLSVPSVDGKRYDKNRRKETNFRWWYINFIRCGEGKKDKKKKRRKKIVWGWSHHRYVPQSRKRPSNFPRWKSRRGSFILLRSVKRAPIHKLELILSFFADKGVKRRGEWEFQPPVTPQNHPLSHRLNA